MTCARPRQTTDGSHEQAPTMTDLSECPTNETLRCLLEQSLDDTTRGSAEQHVGECSACQSRLDELTDAADLVVGAADLSSIPGAVVSMLRETPQQLSDNTSPDNNSKSEHEKCPASVGDFDIAEHIASGASGALYRATDRSLGRTVALKVLHSSVAASESARQRVRREARALASISHGNVVSVYSSGEDENNRPFIAMELVDGDTLGQMLEKRGPFAVRKAATLVEQSARGLAAAHEHGLIHRDIKSSNILVDRESQSALVIDFGLVRENEQQTQLTQEGVLAGTPAYMSPEQIVNPANVDPRTDVYSLGIVLFEILTGVVPFRGVVRMVLQQVQYSEPQPLRELDDAIPSDLQTICLKAIEKDPDRRYQSANELADDLNRWLINEPILARPVGRTEKIWRWCCRNPRIAVLSALVAFALLSTMGVTAASAYQLSVAGQEVKEADGAARRNADALVAQRDAAMETVRKLVFDISPLLQELDADTSHVEQSILQVALEGLNKVAQSAEDSGEIDYNTAHALGQLGNALYMADELESAETQLQRGLRLVERMQQNGEPPKIVAPLQISMQTSLASIDWNLEQPEAEREHYEAALTVARAWHKRSTGNVDATVSLATVCNLLAEFHVTNGSETDAKKLFAESSSLLENLSDDPAVTMELNASLDGLSVTEETVFDPDVDRLKRDLKNELRTRQSQADATPDDQNAKHNLFNALLAMASWHSTFGNSDRAVSLCDTAGGLVSEDDSLNTGLVQRHLADAWYTGGFSLGKTRKAYQRALELLEAGDGTPPIETIRCRVAVGDIFTTQGNGQKALPYLQQAVEDLKQQPDSPESTRLKIDANIGLAWVSYYEDEMAAFGNQLARIQEEFSRLEKASTDSESPDPFLTEWLTVSSEEIADLKAALADTRSE